MNGIKKYLFEPRYHFNRLQFNLAGLVFAVLGFVIASYFAAVKLPSVFALNDTTKTWSFNGDTAGQYTYDDTLVTVDGSVESGSAHPVTGVNKITNPAFTSGTDSWSVTPVSGSTTPTGWALVPGDSNYVATGSAFLAMQYEAKYDCSGDDDGDTAAACSAPADAGAGVDYRDLTFDSTNVVSTANGAPIVHITQTQALSACPSGYHLISNAEWMTIVRNAEAQTANWADGTVGSTVAAGGGMFRGNVGESTSVGYNASTDPDYGTSRDSKAKLTLSNGAEIWDLSGNVWDWNSDTITGANQPDVSGQSGFAWREYTALTGYGSLSYDLLRPSNSSYNADYGVGRIYHDSNSVSSTEYAFLRGGSWTNTSNAGAFALTLVYTPGVQYNYIGFRCASDPVAISQSSSSNPGRAGNGNTITIGQYADARLTQSVNVGDTSTYNLSVYVKNTDNSAVDINTATLYYGGNTISSPAWTNTGVDNWYKLTGTVTGVASSIDTGITVKSGKTVVVDDFTLSKSGTYSVYTTTAYSNYQVSSWDSFSATTTGSGNASVGFQICLDDGSSCSYSTGSRWLYYTGGAWTNATDATTTYTNTAAQLTQAAMQSLSVTSQKISVKAILAFGGSDTPTMTQVQVGLTTDTTAPNNTTAVTMKKNASATATMSANLWTNDSSPYLTWPVATDLPEPGGSGIKGYCLFIAAGDTNPNLKTSVSDYLPDNTPSTLDSVHISSADTQCGNGSGFLVSTNSIDFATAKYRGTSIGRQWLTSSETPYYVYIKTVDNAGNIADDPNVSYHFRFDNTAPNNPSYLSLPGDYIATKSATLLWASSGADAPADEHSKVAGLQYRIGPTGTWYGDLHTAEEDANDLLANDGNYSTVQIPDFANLTEGSNMIYLRTWDNAGNVSTSYISGALKINTVSPSAPRNLTVTPADNTSNSYSFTWDDPSAFTGQASKLTFCYSINTLPTATTCSYTLAGANSLSADAFATQPGSNTLYLVARDEAGNINYDSFTSVTFKYSGSAPGIPRNIDLSDISIKSTSNWKLALSWDTPSEVGAGVDSYRIYRSTTNTTCSANFGAFTQIGTTAGTSYSDTGLSQTTYYYCVKACDSAANCSAVSSTVSKTPTGKYFTPASLTSGPTAGSITTKKATITWSTDRNSDSKVAYGTGPGSYGLDEISNSSQSTSHTINLTNLKAGTTYYYKTKWTDEDGNTGTSDEKTFTTDDAPTVKDVAAKNIGLSSAIIEFTTKGASKVKIYYGETTSFGGAKEVSTSTSETTYTAELTGLNDGTKYYYKINTFDSESGEYEGTILDFTTLPRPKITGVRIQEVKGTAQPTILVSWMTNTDVSSIITYYPEGKLSEARDEVNITLTAGEHRMFVKGLYPQTNYILVVKGRDKIGNEAVSDTQKITTATDTRPPVISNLKIEGQVIPPVGGAGQESSAQLVVSWDTDEPSTSQVEFGEGTGDTYAQKTQEDTNLTTNHLVVMSNLTPSKVYHLRAIAKDKAGNEGKSVDSVTITPKSTQSALDLVVGSLSEVFGFLGNLK